MGNAKLKRLKQCQRFLASFVASNFPNVFEVLYGVAGLR